MENVTQILNIYSDYVYKYLFCLTHDYNLTEELTQETMYRAIKNINKLRDESKIEAWLCKIAKNLWLQELKKKRKTIEINENDLNNVQDKENIEETFMEKEDKKFLYDVIEKFKDDDKELIYLRLIDNLKFKEIANLTGKTETWARVTYYRLKQQIIKEVKEREIL